MFIVQTENYKMIKYSPKKWRRTVLTRIANLTSRRNFACSCNGPGVKCKFCSCAKKKQPCPNCRASCQGHCSIFCPPKLSSSSQIQTSLRLLSPPTQIHLPLAHSIESQNVSLPLSSHVSPCSTSHAPPLLSLSPTSPASFELHSHQSACSPNNEALDDTKMNETFGLL